MEDNSSLRLKQNNACIRLGIYNKEYNLIRYLKYFKVNNYYDKLSYSSTFLFS